MRVFGFENLEQPMSKNYNLEDEISGQSMYMKNRLRDMSSEGTLQTNTESQEITYENRTQKTDSVNRQSGGDISAEEF